MPISGWKRFVFALAAVFALVALAFGGSTASAAELAQPRNPVLPWVLLFAGFGVLWVVFYKGLYPFLLRYYRDRVSRSFFWELLLLYAVTWLHLASYLVFDWAFQDWWLGWVPLFFAGLFVIWFFITFLRRRA